MPAMTNTKEVLRKDEFGLVSAKQEPVYEAVKRVFDFFAALCAMVLTLPIMLVIAIAIKYTDGGPVVHTRICEGKSGRRYKMYKFRSMVVDADNLKRWLTPQQLQEYITECKLENDPRITQVGRLIRKTSLDELPQLFSVLKGDMSLVGPRPIVSSERQHYKDGGVNLLLSVKPGVTGYWQVNGRSDTTYESGKRQEMELYYAANRSFALDVKIMLRTVSVVLKGKGAK